MTHVKPLLRFLRTSLPFLSLLLLIGTLVLWFRSRTNLDEFYTYRPLSYRSIWSVEGRFYIFLWSAPAQFWGESSMGFSGGDLSRLKYDVPISRRFGPFGYNHTTSTNPALVLADGHIFMFPHWFLVLFLAIPPALALRRFIRHRSTRFRAAYGLCLRCGYDTRATPDRCPECGHEKTPVTVARS
jgi:hypothetical protein